MGNYNSALFLGQAEDAHSVVSWAQKEFNKIQSAIGDKVLSVGGTTNVAPPKPREGSIALADGTHWNPGAGAGPYIYAGGNWRPMAPGGTAQTGFAPGAVAFGGPGGALTQDGTKFFWDATNHRLGIGTNSPGYALDIQEPGSNGTQLRVLGSSASANIQIQTNAANQQAIVSFYETAGVFKWQLGKQTDNSFFMYDAANNKNWLSVSTAGDMSIGESTRNVTLQNAASCNLPFTGITNGIAASGNEFMEWRPSDWATGKPYIFLKATSNQNWQFGLWDGTNNAGNIHFLCGAVILDGSTFLQVGGGFELLQTPAAVANTVSIASGADSATNLGHRLFINMNGTNYWIPCGTVAF